jgi:NitT/TauT family transport system ATP-binding protein
LAYPVSVPIRFEAVSKTFERDGAHTVALDKLSFEVTSGEYVCIVGRTGSGKSTTLNLTLGLMAPTAGRITVLGHDPHSEFSELKGQLGCIFQGDRLLPWRSALDNVRLPLEILKVRESTLRLTPVQWLEKVGLKDFSDALPHELSGGMRQRVAIARAMVSDPQIVLADEAFGHLDEVTGNRIKTDFKRLVSSTGKTVLHITHSIEEAIGLADRIVVFGPRGRISGSFLPGAGEGDLQRLRRSIYEQVEDERAPPEAMGI